NIQLEGLVSPSIVSNETEKQVSVLLRNSWAKITPTVVKTMNGNEFSSILELRNNGDFPLEVTGSFVSETNYLFEPEKIKTIVEPENSVLIPVKLKTGLPVPIENLLRQQLKLNGRFLQENKNLSAINTVEWTIDNWKKVTKTDTENKYFIGSLPAEIEESWDWSGRADGELQYKINYDKDFIYLSIKTTDDSLVVNNDIEKVQDKVKVFFSADTTFGNTNFLEFEFVPNQKVKISKSASGLEGIDANCKIQGNSVLCNLKLPRTTLKNNFFRLNFSFTDSDNHTNLEPSILWWRPRWGKTGDYPQSGIFYIED
ncbi:MAG TPA: hypothetical protein PLC80_19720, partial [Draconibacterium sp.]|nr:hypothetical protein [Draconibacterium sp.]